MKHNSKRASAMKLLSIALVVIVGMSVLPFAGGNVHGASNPKIVENKSWTTPSNWPSMYDVYMQQVIFNTKVNQPNTDGGFSLYMDTRVKIKGKKYGAWQRVKKMNDSWQQYTITGFKRNAVYQARLYYGKQVGNTLYRSPYSKVQEFRTGSPIYIKSIKVTPVNMQTRRQHVFGYVIYWGSLKFYTYQYKITVTLKKKPNAAGMMINGKKALGNKTVYTVYTPKMDSYSKPYGRSYTVVVNAYKSWRYGGYSQLVKKNVKVSR